MKNGASAFEELPSARHVNGEKNKLQFKSVMTFEVRGCWYAARINAQSGDDWHKENPRGQRHVASPPWFAKVSQNVV